MVKKMYKVKLRHGREYYFSSLAAIYRELSEEEIGCKLTRLWSARINETGYFMNKFCEIQRINFK